MTERRNIQTIAPFLADDFVQLDEPIFDTHAYAVFLDENANRLGTFKKYLICKLHDSWVINTNHENDKFKITLNDFSTYVFAATIIEKYNLPIDPNHISFPLTIEFEGNFNVEYNKVDDDGSLKHLNPTGLDVYLYEQVTHIDNEKIEIVFHFWKSSVDVKRPGERVIVIASAKYLSIAENQDKAWTEVFGDRFTELYRYFKTQFESESFVSDSNECENLIEEYNKKK